MNLVDVNHNPYGWRKKARNVEIHKGFMEALFTKSSGTIWYSELGLSQRLSGRQAFRVMDRVQQSINHVKPTRILVSGHSLG
jgi:hypothetical protein